MGVASSSLSPDSIRSRGGAAARPMGLLALDSAAFNDSSKTKSAISASRSFETSCRRIISFSRLAALFPPAEIPTPFVLFGRLAGCGAEIERFGREEKEFEGECEMRLLLPWPLEKEALRDLAENSSCESDLYERLSKVGEKSSVG